MTALNDYLRLESTGLWRPAPGEQRRDVFVFLGDASLVVADKSETALSHWSLPAIERQNPGKRPAIFMPAMDAGETLEIDDNDMIDAIEKVRRAVKITDPKPGRLRLWGGLTMVASLLALGVFWLPDALVRHGERVVPAPSRAALGERVLAHVTDIAGGRCENPEGLAELRRLARRIAPGSASELVVLDNWRGGSGHLPGGIILLDRLLIDAHDTPDVLAGHALTERLRSQSTDPMGALLRDAGTFDTLRFLATGTMQEDALQRHAEGLVGRGAAPVDADTLLARFEEARVSSSAFAESLTAGSQLRAQIEGRDPFVDGLAPMILPDNAWVTLQAICERG